MREFTKEQIDNFRAYEEVRQKSSWNMYSPDAREATGLTRQEYRFTMKNYVSLKEQCAKECGDE